MLHGLQKGLPTMVTLLIFALKKIFFGGKILKPCFFKPVPANSQYAVRSSEGLPYLLFLTSVSFILKSKATITTTTNWKKIVRM